MEKFIKILAGIFLAVFALLAVLSATFENATVDEVAHITAGYSYLTKQDMRLNPEHPPLLKDISAVFLLPLNLKFPAGSTAWTEEINGEWGLGHEFFYKNGNDPDKILFWARLGTILLAVLLGAFIFKFAKEFFNSRVALLALFLFLFSPTILAHSRYATTDIAAAFGFFTAIFYFLKFLKEPNKKNLIIAGVFFGIAQLFKFSLILLVPFFIIIAIVWIFAEKFQGSTLKYNDVGRRYIHRMMAGSVLIFIIGYFFVVWPIYQLHILNYPTGPQNAEEKALILSIESCDELDKTKIAASQFRDTACQLKTYKGPTFVKDAVVWAADKPGLRPFAEYALGALMASQKTSEGSLNYFLGTVSYEAHKSYFPIAYLIKEPLALHILTLFAIYIFFSRLNLEEVRLWRFNLHSFVELVLFLFIVFYLAFSIFSNLNIGIRHIIPIYPFIFLLISVAIIRKLESLPEFEFRQDLQTIKKISSFYFHKLLNYAVMALLLFWYVGSSLSVFPNFLTYFNEAVGGPKNGYKYLSDSNLDWGQSLKELAVFVDKNDIEKINLDYFGNGSPEHYLKEKYIPWSSEKGAPKGWFAVSAHYLDVSTGTLSGEFKREEKDSYIWLKDKKPIEKIGNSIFIYRFE